MTERRSLKKLVRERMQRTGESYTTAYRHLTARKTPPSGSSITPGYPGFGADAHVPSALARGLLAQAGLEVSEAMACGLGGGIGFLYAVFEYKQVDHPLLTIVAQHHPKPWLEQVAEHLGVTLRSLTSSKAETAIGKLGSMLSSGRAAHLDVARGMLPWHPATSAEEAADPHGIVIAGRHGEAYLVDDGIGSPHRLTVDELSVAWAAHRKGRFALRTFGPATDVDLAAAIKASLATTHAHLTGPVLGHAFDVNMGLSGMQKFAAELRDQTTRSGWRRRFGAPEAFGIGMTRIAECLTWAYTAEGGTRPLYAKFLAEAGALSGLDLDEAAAAAAASGDGWRAVADLAADAAGTHSADDGILEELAGLVEACIAQERRLADRIAAALGLAG